MKIVTAQRGIKKNSGFTLLELIISMAILMVLVSVLTTLFGQILDVQLESKANSTIDQNGRFIQARLAHDFQSSSDIVTPATPGEITDTLQITVNSVDYIYSLDNSGNLLLTQNAISDVLNTNSASISAVTFTRIGSGDSNDTVRVGFTITTRGDQQRGIEQKSFQTTLGLH